MTDVVVNKVQSIQRWIKRAREEYAKDPRAFETDFTHQDAALLNVLRACEQSIDLANHIIRIHRFGVPPTSSEAFDLLQRERVIDAEAERLKKMVQFRNILVHQYQRVDITLVRAAIETGLDDLIHFCDAIVKSPKPLVSPCPQRFPIVGDTK